MYFPRLASFRRLPFFVLPLLPGVVSGQNIGQSSFAAYSRAAGKYNTSAITFQTPEDEQSHESESDARTSVNLSSGPLWASVVSKVKGQRINVGVALQAGPSASLGSKITGTAAAKFTYHLAYPRLANVLAGTRGNAVVRVKGSFTKPDVPLSNGSGRLTILTIAEDDGTGRDEILLEESTTIDQTLYIPVVNEDDTAENRFAPLLLPAVYIFECEIILSLDCETGAQNGTPLQASTFARVGTSLTQPPGPARGGVTAGGIEIGLPGHGATIMGIQFVDAGGNVLDIPPGEVVIQTAPGLNLPILGSSLPWLANSDDFNDDFQNTRTWAAQTGTGTLEEVDFSLEYSADAGTRSALWPLKGNKAPLTENWQVQTDVHWEPHDFSTAGDEAGIGIRVSGGTHAAVVRMERKRAGAATVQSFRAAESGMAAPLVTTVPAPNADGAVRLSYNAATKELTYWYDPNGPVGGYSWTSIQKSNLGPSGWNLPADALLSVEIGGWSAGSDGVPFATAWLDNFSAGSWESFAPLPGSLYYQNDAVTITGFAEPNQIMMLQASDNLQLWNDLAPLVAKPDGSLSFTSARGGRAKRYFRFRY